MISPLKKIRIYQHTLVYRNGAKSVRNAVQRNGVVGWFVMMFRFVFCSLGAKSITDKLDRDLSKLNLTKRQILLCNVRVWRIIFRFYFKAAFCNRRHAVNKTNGIEHDNNCLVCVCVRLDVINKKESKKKYQNNHNNICESKW